MIIGISAKAGCGKSTLAYYLARARADVVRLSFAGVLKLECADRFEFPLEWTLTQEGKLQVVEHEGLPGGRMTVREILQWWGTDVCRAKDPDYWLKAMDGQIARVRATLAADGIGEPLVLIDDVRFPNEALYCSSGGLCVRLQPFAGWAPGPGAAHESETALDDWTAFDLVLAPGYGELAGCVPHILAALAAQAEKTSSPTPTPGASGASPGTGRPHAAT
jgi:hypothetical protein